MKPKPSKTLIALWSISPPPRSLNSGYSTAPTTIIPATKQAARKANRMTNRRPIRDIAALRSSIRHRHGAQRLALARGQFFGLRLQLTASGEDVAATRRAHRGRITGVENIFGEFF